MTVDSHRDLLKSPLEQERKKAIALLAREPCREVLIALQEVAEVDENLEVRFYARKALAVVKANIQLTVTEGGAAPVPESLDAAGFAQLDEERRCALVQGAIADNRTDLLPVLREVAMRESQPRVLAALVIAIGKFGAMEDSKVLVPLLAHADSRVRANTIEALEMLGSLKVFAYILPLLEDPDNRVRANAAKSLRSIDPMNSFRLLQAMLSSGKVPFQASAVFVLRFFRSDRTAALVAPFLADPHESIRSRAHETMRLLADSGVEQAARLLAAAGGDALDAAPAAPEAILAEIGHEPVVAAVGRSKLEEAFGLPEPRQRLAAIESEVVQLGEAAIAPLQAHLEREADAMVVGKIFILLGRLRSSAAVPTLVCGLQHADTRCRANAVEALGMIGDPVGLEAVVPLLQDPNNRIRGNAVLALRGRPGVDITTPLIELLESSRELDQRTVVFVLTEMAQPEYFPLLTMARQSRFAVVRKSAEAAIEALKRVGHVFVEEAEPQDEAAAPPAPPTSPSLPPPASARPNLRLPTGGGQPPASAGAGSSSMMAAVARAATPRAEVAEADDAPRQDLVACRWCKEPIIRGAKKCRHCNEFQRDEDRMPRPRTGSGEAEDDWGTIIGLCVVTFILLLVPFVNGIVALAFMAEGLHVFFKMLGEGCSTALLAFIPFGPQWFAWNRRADLFENSNLVKVWVIYSSLLSGLIFLSTLLSIASGGRMR